MGSEMVSSWLTLDQGPKNLDPIFLGIMVPPPELRTNRIYDREKIQSMLTACRYQYFLFKQTRCTLA